jgi:hypothetical protein
VHVPLVTNDDCYFAEGGVVYQMRFGELWFFDASREHSAASFSDQRRVHLLVDFPDVDDPTALVRLPLDGPGGIPASSICGRPPLTTQEREAVLELASIIDLENYRDVFSIVIKTHYRRDGGAHFVWETLLEIGARSGNEAVDHMIRSLHEHFLIDRVA